MSNRDDIYFFLSIIFHFHYIIAYLYNIFSQNQTLVQLSSKNFRIIENVIKANFRSDHIWANAIKM